MICGNIDGFEIQKLGLDFGPGRDVKTQTRENLDDPRVVCVMMWSDPR